VDEFAADGNFGRSDYSVAIFFSSAGAAAFFLFTNRIFWLRVSVFCLQLDYFFYFVLADFTIVFVVPV